MSDLLQNLIILVPQGSEYQAVSKGLQQLPNSKIEIFPIPIGDKPVREYLKTSGLYTRLFQQPNSNILVMGLCGSLNPSYGVGDVVVYKECIYENQVYKCDENLTSQISGKLNLNLVRGLICGTYGGKQRMINSATEKRQLHIASNADVVDMEGFAILNILQPLGIAVGMLRVVSDDCKHDIPDLNSAIDAAGNLQSLPLAWAMIRQPLASVRLIRGSLRSLKVLEKISYQLYS
ncbi:purine or other phosphorylase family 1 [Calothrix sp. PCC 6303]|uniref:5'-methylthioadenosine/S-adenosylhomocysteine nucleosidase family protein n=1 Tax=Calothrix sp. PCC 6303 TaxID=1170562 RepID=UPI0002A043D9|nr:purine or other phosphorylase family 1 [Calothrix sp. PCC 6303]AFZ02114.1 purine or other phosphorylase family 1 [Calothrix sp. PCC 6303]